MLSGGDRDREGAGGGGARALGRVVLRAIAIAVVSGLIAAAHGLSGAAEIEEYESDESRIRVLGAAADGAAAGGTEPSSVTAEAPVPALRGSDSMPEDRELASSVPPEAADPVERTDGAGGDEEGDLVTGPLDCESLIAGGIEREVDLAGAAALWRCAYERGALVVHFLDARRRDDFDAGRVQGAIWMPARRVLGLDGLDALNALGVLPEDVIVIYCTGGDCDASKNTAAQLQQAGYTNIVIMTAGYDEWAAAGLPTEM